MNAMKKDIFRKAALERLANADQLDKVMKITSPLSWLALLGVTIIIVWVVFWSFTGELPSTVTANGVIVSSSTATNTLIANGEGTVVMYVSEGERIDEGDVFATITPNNPDEAVIDCVSDQYGWVSSILVNNAAVTPGTALMRIRPVTRWEGQKQVAVCYVPFADIGKIKYNQEATITLTSAGDSSYGHMSGSVINIDRQATSNNSIEAVVGSDNSMAQQFMKDGGVCAVTIGIYSNEGMAQEARNDYWWSNAKGYQLEVNDKMMCMVRIKTDDEKVRPIDKLFTHLKDVWSGNK